MTDQGPPVIALCSGEPAGIGPEITLIAAAREQAAGVRLVVIGDADLLAARAARIGLPLRLVPAVLDRPAPGDALEIVHLPLAVPARPGVLDPRNARAVLAILDTAIDGALSGRFAAMVTAPLHKAVINDAGIAFTGHTEYLARRSAAPAVVMMLVGGGMRVALATTHLALADVPAAIDQAALETTLAILAADLDRRFGIAQPRILVAGLNPHAGEGGYLGREEIERIAPAIAAVRARGIDARGPLPADTLFQRKYLEGSDAVLAMYHDQGLSVLKYASFGLGVNVTLGLPFIRTSVDHGTALDLTLTGAADAGSMQAAIALARTMAATGRR